MVRQTPFRVRESSVSYPFKTSIGNLFEYPRASIPPQKMTCLRAVHKERLVKSSTIENLNFETEIPLSN